MTNHRLLTPKALILAPLTLLLFIAVACGGTAAEPVIVEKEVVKEVIKEVPVEVIKEVPVEVIREVIREVPVEVIKEVPVEVIREVSVEKVVIKEVVVIATPVPAPVVVVAPKYGGFINMLDYAATSRRQIHRSQLIDRTFAPLFNKLVEFNPETDDISDIRCDLCTSWELAEDGVTYTFQLVPNAKWWDGVPVTAADIVFMFESIVAPDQFEILKGRPTTGNLQVGLYYESGNARAVDDHTVEVVTKFPTGSFISSLAVDGAMVQAKHTVIDQGIIQTGSDMGTLNGSGPFKFVKHIKDVSVAYAKNPDYFKEGRPYINGMKHFVIVDSGRTIAAFKSGQVLTSNQALTNMTTREAERLDQDMDNLSVFWGGPTGARHVYMNTTKAPFDNANVRKAVHLAIYRQPIIETMSVGRDSIGYLNPPGFWYSRTQEEYDQLPGYRELNGEKHPGDVAEAQRLLKEAGLPPNLKVTLSTRNCCAYPDLSVLVKQQLEKNLGWDIDIKTWESAAGFKAYFAGDFQFMIQGSRLTSTSPDVIHSRWVKGGVPQWQGGGRGKFFAVEGVEDLFDKQLHEPDQEKRKVLLTKLADTLYDGGSATATLFWNTRHWPVEKRIQNFNFTLEGRKWEHVWCDPAC